MAAMPEIDTTDFRKLLIEALDNDELMALCQDYFPAVYNKVSTGMTRHEIVRLLLDYCNRNTCLPRLLEAAQRYSDRFAHIVAVRPPAAPPVAGSGLAATNLTPPAFQG